MLLVFGSRGVGSKQADAPGTTEVSAPSARLVYSYPIGREGRAPGDGFFIRHGYGVENTWYLRGHW